MSSKKITDADKLEIVDLYRQSGDTTASLASRYGVSNSTISRLLKTSIPEAEYEILIQQKRVSKVESAEDDLAIIDQPNIITPPVILPELERVDQQTNSFIPPLAAATSVEQTLMAEVSADRDLVLSSLPASMIEDNNPNNRRVRRRSSAPVGDEQSSSSNIAEIELPIIAMAAATLFSSSVDSIDLPPKIIVPPPISRTPVLREILADSQDRYAPPPAPLPLTESSSDELEEDLEPEDVNALAAMFGEEIADGDDDDDQDPDSEDWDEDATSSSYQQLDRDRLLTEDRLHIQVTPLSQATLPRTCYIVIDKFAELIVRPLKDFADLGQISGEEIQQRTLPIFDNHRVAKRFSNQRTQRVIKVPDSRVFHKTTQHLRSKGITRLLVDGNIYSLN
jgi:transposase-like protein